MIFGKTKPRMSVVDKHSILRVKNLLYQELEKYKFRYLLYVLYIASYFALLSKYAFSTAERVIKK